MAAGNTVCKRAEWRRSDPGRTPVGPRETLRAPGGGRHEPRTRVRAGVCCFVRRASHRPGIRVRLLRGDRGPAAGADAIAGCPVDPVTPRYRFMDLVAAFRAAGYWEFGRSAKPRHAMRRWPGS